MRKIYKFAEDCGRMGDLNSIFTAESTDVENVIGKTVHFGEVLGKHSEISVEVTEANFTVLSDDQDFVAKFEQILGTGTVSGNNPLDYYEPEAATTTHTGEGSEEFTAPVEQAA